MELEFAAAQAGRYRVQVLATAAPDYGCVRVSLDRLATEPTFELYSGQIRPAGSLELGTRELVAGPHNVRFDVMAGTRPRRASASVWMLCTCLRHSDGIGSERGGHRQGVMGMMGMNPAGCHPGYRVRPVACGGDSAWRKQEREVGTR